MKPSTEEELLSRITVNRAIFGGKPIVRNRRLAVEHVLGMLAAGDTPETLLSGYPWLESEDIRACILYAQRLVGHDGLNRLCQSRPGEGSADVCVWGGAADVLRASQHEVEVVAEWPEDPGDEEILRHAAARGQVLVTIDKDFGELVVVRGRHTPASSGSSASALESRAQHVLRRFLVTATKSLRELWSRCSVAVCGSGPGRIPSQTIARDNREGASAHRRSEDDTTGVPSPDTGARGR